LGRRRNNPSGPTGSRGARRIRGPRTELGLAREWQLWIVENLLRGVPSEQVCRGLVEQGVPLRLAAHEVAEIEQSAALHTCRWLEHRRRALASRAYALNELRKNATEVDRHAMLSGEEFFTRYYATNTPVLLTELTKEWPALALWTPSYLRERHGNLEVEIVEGRSTNPYSDHEYERLRRITTMAELAARVEASDSTNDFYAIARNRNAESPGFADLRKDVVPPEDWFDRERFAGAQSFWFGPKGTITTLHYDPTNILFCQLYGTKLVHLAPPSDSALSRAARGYYSGYVERAPEDEPELRNTPFFRIELRPGDALFIPALWWHRVEALSASISFSLLHFRRPNRFPHYRP
jgi:hypothetical protein